MEHNLLQLQAELYDLILDAVMEPERQDERLDEADKLLTKIRLYVRLSYDLKCISLGQLEHAARLMDEIGRLIGNWKRKRAKERRESKRERKAAAVRR